MIVIVIVGVVYTLAINNFSRLKEQSKTLSLQTLKEYLNDIVHEESVELICLDDCSKCDVYVDGEKSKTLEDFLDDSIKVYRYEC